MNRYVLLDYLPVFSIVLQVLDSEEAPPAVPPNEPFASWMTVPNDELAQVGCKREFGSTGYIYTPLNDAELLYASNTRLQLRLDAAGRWLACNPLQYKLDLGVATSADEEALLAYKQYYVAVSEVNKQSGFPAAATWPALPFPFT